MAKPTRVAKSTTAKAMKSYPSLVNTTGRLLGQVPEKNKEKPKNNYGKAVGIVADRLSGVVAAKGMGKTIGASYVSGLPLQNSVTTKKNIPTQTIKKASSTQANPTLKNKPRGATLKK